jgi:cytochrome c-type biogenesis protein CcmH/NrfF
LEQEEALLDEAFAILRPADNYGGRMSFLWVAPFAFLVGLVFLFVLINDRRKGGYQAVRLQKEDNEVS